MRIIEEGRVENTVLSLKRDEKKIIVSFKLFNEFEEERQVIIAPWEELTEVKAELQVEATVNSCCGEEGEGD